MVTIILSVVEKNIAIAGTLLLLYLVLFRGKSSYRESRIFLMVIPLLSLVLSLVVVRYEPEPVTVEVDSASVVAVGERPATRRPPVLRASEFLTAAFLLRKLRFSYISG